MSDKGKEEGIFESITLFQSSTEKSSAFNIENMESSHPLFHM